MGESPCYMHLFPPDESLPSQQQQQQQRESSVVASGTKNKNWVLTSLDVDGELVPVQDSDTNTKTKVDIVVCDGGTGNTQFIRIYNPGNIEFSDKDYEQSQGSRLATDMKMTKVPDQLLFEISFTSIISLERQPQDGKKLKIVSISKRNCNKEEEGVELSIILELASKWSMNDFITTIKKESKGKICAAIDNL